MIEYLKQEAESMPEWLAQFTPGDNISIEDIRYSRCAIYPGAWNDGCLIETCNRAHCCHLYLYIDYWYKDEELNLENNTFWARGYDIIDRIGMYELLEMPCTPHIPEALTADGKPNGMWHYEPMCLMYIYHRQPEYDDTHGAKRFAVIAARYDAIDLYDKLFANRHFTNPYILLDQEHGLGGNYDRYDNLMQRIAIRSKVFPKYIISEENSVWKTFRHISVNPVIGGMHHNCRHLYIHNNFKDKDLPFLEPFF